MNIKNTYTTLLIMLCTTFVCGQESNLLDSLQGVLDNTSAPKERVNILLEMANHARVTRSADDAILYLDEAEKTAKELNLPEIIAQTNIEKGKIVTGQGQYDQAESLFKNALEIYKEADNDKYILNCLNALGIVSRRKGDYEAAAQYLEQATIYFSDSIDDQNKGGVLTNLSNVYFRLNQFSLAYEKIYEGLEYYEKAGFTRGIGLAYGNLGLLYKAQKDYENAILYFNKSLEIVIKENDLRGQYNAYNNLSTTYTTQGKYEEALLKNKQQLDIAQMLGADELVIFSKMIIASKYIELDSLTKASKILLEIKPDIPTINKRYQANYYRIDARLNRRLKAYQKSIAAAEKAYELDAEMGDYSSLEKVLALLHELYSETGDFEKAYNYFAEFKVVADSLKSENNIAALTTQEMQFAFDKEKETAELEKKALESNLRVQKFTRWAAIIVAFLVGLIGIIYYRSAQKQNRLLSEDLKNKQTIEAQAKQLQAFNTELEATVAQRTAELEQANYELRTFNYIASHDIKEPIRSIGNYAGLIFRKLPKDQQAILKTYFDTIKNSTSQLYTLIEDFARYTTMSKNEAVTTQSIDLNALMNNVESGLESSIQKYNGLLTYQDLPTINTSSSLLYAIFKNIIDNGLKYNQSTPPIVEVSYASTDTHHQIIIKDDGIGIAKEYHEKIFEMFKRLHNRSIYTGSGIGLAIVKLCVEKLNGTIELESEEGKGSQFMIKLPL